MRRLTVCLMVCFGVLVQGVSAQAQTGSIAGRVTDGMSGQPVANANVVVEGTQIGTLTQNSGAFLIPGVPAGTYNVTASLIGYGPVTQAVTVPAGGTVSIDFAMQPQAVVLEEIVATGYGTQRRVAITGSIATVSANEANVGVVTNANNLIQGRIAGLATTVNNGEPGAGVQVRIRGGTSISASNDPLYVIDGVPVENEPTVAAGIGIGGSPPLPRNPLNMLNPNDIESISVLKDASASAIYGSRAANGVVLITTKGGAAGATTFEYDGYVSAASQASYLDVLNGAEYRQFVQQQVAAGALPQSRLDGLGSSDTDWERELGRTGITHNHNLSFSGGTRATRFRASLNYTNQQGIVRSSGFERIQGRLNGTHSTWEDRLRVDLNLTTSHVLDDFLPFENSGGFEGGVFQNMAIFNPTRPVTVRDPDTGLDRFYEIGTGRLSVRNPVAIADQVLDNGITTRTLGNITTRLSLLDNLTGQVIVGVDRSDGNRKVYFPAASPVGAEWNGRASQVNRTTSAVTLQTLLTLQQELMEGHSLEVVGGYEFNDYQITEFGAEARNFITDLFTFNNLGGGADLVRPFSFQTDSRLVSFFGRAAYNMNDKYFLTGVLRYDGSSRFGAGNKWALFPALSGSWRISAEDFWSEPLGINELRLRAGWGKQGNQAVPPYSSLVQLDANDGARYVFGELPVTGVAPSTNPNPNLKWEETRQINVALDYGFADNLFSGSVEYYRKNTTDLLLEVNVAQPAAVSTRLENIGEVRNTGLEASLEALVINDAQKTLRAGLVFSRERNEVVDLGGRTFITSGDVSGQGQSGQVSQRILPGYALGTFYGPKYLGTNANGEQLFAKYTVQRDAAGNVISREQTGETTAPGGDDFLPIGDANPSFTVGVTGNLTWGSFDISTLIRAEQGRDVFNNTALVYSTKSNALQDKNFLQAAVDDPTGITQPAIYSSRWIEDGSFVRLQNLTVGYSFEMPNRFGSLGNGRVYLSGDNLLLLTGYSGYDPEVHAQVGLASRGIDYLAYPRARTFTFGLQMGGR